MRLKEIKPGMAIHCNDKNEKKVLFEELKRLGYVWCGKSEINADYDCEVYNNTIYVFSEEEEYPYKNITHGNGKGNIEFSDLIIPDLTPEEVISILGEICKTHPFCGDCPINSLKEIGDECPEVIGKHKGEVMDIMTKWKMKHEKKKPEFEWIWEGRIYEIHDNDKGNFYQLDDGNGFYDTGCTCQESAEDYMTDVLKDYCSTHEGEYIAIVDRVCRVKQ